HLKLDAALTGDLIDAPRTSAAPAPATSTAASTNAAVATTESAVAPASGRRYPRWLLPAIVLGVVVIAIAGYFTFVPRGNASLDQGVAAYKAGQREVALSAFTKASSD